MDLTLTKAADTPAKVNLRYAGFTPRPALDSDCDNENVPKSIMDLDALARRLESEIKTYKYEVPESVVGTPWSAERVVSEIASFKTAVVKPYWTDVELRDTPEQIAMVQPSLRRCVVVADDTKSATVVLFDPIEGEFLLGQRRSARIVTIGVRGDAVGCFMAR